MHVDPTVASALRPFARRASIVEFVRTAMVTIPAGVVLAEILWLDLLPVSIDRALATGVIATATLAVTAMMARIGRPEIADVARRADRQARLQDLVISGLQSSLDSSPIASLVRRDAVAALNRQTANEIYPIEMPRRWRSGAVALLASQAIVLTFIWQPPSARPAQQSALSLELPSGNAGSSAAPKKQDSGPVASSTTPSVTAPGVLTTKSTSSPAGSETVQGPADLIASPVAGSAAGDRLRLAAASAEVELTAGRVPAARRAIVERYFAALQSQRKTPR
jgi:hypothetical protein